MSMAQVTVTIDGREFEVACEEGQESFLQAAAQLLDVEATAMSGQIGRMSERRMLLMAGLMLADRYANLAERVDAAEAETDALRAELADLSAREPERIEVPVVPKEVTEGLEQIAARAEALADDLESRS